MPYKKIIGNGENAGYQHFLLFTQCFLPQVFPQCFLAVPNKILCFQEHRFFLSAKLLSSGKE